MVTLTDVIVLTGAGLVGGICIGLLINDKRIKRVKEQIDDLEEDYSNLVDKYTECIVEKHRLQFERYLKPIPPVKKDVVVKKKAGRPKGSTNKPKTNGRSTTRKYTRKSSK
jgi:uncharacterized protein YneF (UPF0154 family)